MSLLKHSRLLRSRALPHWRKVSFPHTRLSTTLAPSLPPARVGDKQVAHPPQTAQAGLPFAASALVPPLRAACGQEDRKIGGSVDKDNKGCLLGCQICHADCQSANLCQWQPALQDGRW